MRGLKSGYNSDNVILYAWFKSSIVVSDISTICDIVRMLWFLPQKNSSWKQGYDRFLKFYWYEEMLLS